MLQASRENGRVNTQPLPMELTLSVFVSDGVGLPGNQASKSHLLPSCHQDFLLWCGASTFLAPTGRAGQALEGMSFLCWFLFNENTRPAEWIKRCDIRPGTWAAGD